MKKKEIHKVLDEIQKKLESIEGTDASFMFVAKDECRGTINGDEDDIAAMLVMQMARYPVVRNIYYKAVMFFSSLTPKEISEINGAIHPKEEVFKMS